MGADQQHWDYGVVFTGKQSTPPVVVIPPAHDHELKLSAGRWRCACGYTLGDGRDKFLARCTRQRDLL